jgi:hypothetical protein
LFENYFNAVCFIFIFRKTFLVLRHAGTDARQPLFDVAVVSPVLNQAALHAGAAISARKATKMRTHDDACALLTMHQNRVNLSLEMHVSCSEAYGMGCPRG